MSGVTSDPSDPRLTRGPDSGPSGQAEVYLVLPEELRNEDAFVRPVRRTYTHDTCGAATRMSLPLAETYARRPDFYGSTYCVGCHMHLPVGEFRWDDGTRVGS